MPDCLEMPYTPAVRGAEIVEAETTTDAANLIELYDCQIGRITSLTDAWAVSVQYEVPSEHQDEILAALSANYVGGNNPYLERYDELYPSAKPVLK